MVLVERGIFNLISRSMTFCWARLNFALALAMRPRPRLAGVANHTSGLPLHYQFFYVDEAFRPTRDETIRRYGNLVTAPGERYQYSNLGYGLLDYIIERKSGKKFADFSAQGGLSAAGDDAYLDRHCTRPGIASGDSLYAWGRTDSVLRLRSSGGFGRLCQHPQDLARFAMFHMKEHLAEQHPILRDESIDQMQAPTADNPSGAGYGVGWGSNKTRRATSAWSTAAACPACRPFASSFPSERLAVVVLANSSTGLPYRLAEMITNIVLPEPKAVAAAPAAEAQPTAETKSDEKKPDEKKEDAKPEEKKAEEKAPPRRGSRVWPASGRTAS